MKTIYIFLLLCAVSASALDLELSPKIAAIAPQIDGAYDAAWFEADKINVKRIQFDKNIEIRSLIYGDSIYFFIQWQDSTENKNHKPWRWDGRQRIYSVGTEREDSLIFRWAIPTDEGGRLSSANDVW